MADPKEDVKPELGLAEPEPAKESSPEAKPEEPGKSPAEADSEQGKPETKESEPGKSEQTEPESEADKTVPYTRFKEINDAKNDLSKRLELLEGRFQDQEEKSQPSPVDNAVQRLVSKGMDEDSAKELVETQFEIARSAIEPMRKSTAQAEIDSWVKDFKANHSDYDELEPLMYETFKSLDPQTKDAIASSKQGVELLYSHVKNKKLESQLEVRYQEGLKAGYKGKRDKSAVSTSEGSSTTKHGLPSPQDIASMSLEEYAERREEILANADKISKLK